MNEVIERIIHHVNTEWGIKVMLKDKTKNARSKRTLGWSLYRTVESSPL